LDLGLESFTGISATFHPFLITCSKQPARVASMETGIGTLARKAQSILMQGVCQMQWAFQNIFNTTPSTHNRVPVIGGSMKSTTRTTKNKKTRITIETERVWLIERPDMAKNWCPACGKLVTSVSTDEVASLASCAQGSHRPFKIDQLHFLGTADGLMQVCSESLLSQM
jgi:hypothetical protein